MGINVKGLFSAFMLEFSRDKNRNLFAQERQSSHEGG